LAVEMRNGCEGYVSGMVVLIELDPFYFDFQWQQQGFALKREERMEL
jgi:hypothetical protein